MLEKGRVLKIIVAAVVLIAIGFSAGFYSHIPIRKRIIQFKRNRNFRAEQQHFTEKFLNKEAPPITTNTIDGKQWTLHSQRDKVVLIFFWASTCIYSQRAIPAVEEIYKTYNEREDFTMVGVSLDQDIDTLTCFASIKEIPWTILFEDGKGWNNSFSQKFEIHRIPSLWIIDKNGVTRGFHMRTDEAESTLSALLKGESIVPLKTSTYKTKKQHSNCTE